MDVADYIESYRGTLPRVQYPRKTAPVKEISRETCSNTFDVPGFKYKILKDGALQGRYGFIVSFEGKTEFFTYPTLPPTAVKEGIASGVSVPSVYEKGGYSTRSMFGPTDRDMLNSFLENGLPVLGIIKLMLPDGQYHMVTYLLRKTDPKDYRIDFFETYDTSSIFLKGSNEWMQSVGREMIKHLPDFSKETDSTLGMFRQVINPNSPPGINLQQDDDKYGRCVMWALVFLRRLSQMPDLKTKTDFSDLYKELIAENKTEEGRKKIMGLVYGSARKGRKTYRSKKIQKRRTMRHFTR